jgi:hypothetical protein
MLKLKKFLIFELDNGFQNPLNLIYPLGKALYKIETFRESHLSPLLKNCLKPLIPPIQK